MTGDVLVRPATANDYGFLREMLYEAVFWNPDGDRPSIVTAMQDPSIAHYIEGFRRPGDFGLVAETLDKEPVGATWFRFFSAANPSYGYVAGDVPEIAIAVIDGWRGKGLGSRLLQELLSCAHEAGLARVSLSVSPANPAKRLYERLGFVRVGHTDPETMVAELSSTR